ncbi:ATP-dependent DNA helicase [Streptococcus cristatus]|uniref:ATP-dependent DNA helicase n=1 Tax=Streptococcus cristatus TaxID=45634 RepID=UPI0011E70BE8|nr:AAA family ATPase [Streptococcus cristatus]
MEIDKHILVIDKNICKNIKLIKETGERGFFSQNIMNELRNFVEHIALKIYNHDNDVDLEWNYDNLDLGKKYIYENSNYIFLRKFHKFLQPSASHYTLDENNSERLMIKYYEYLLRIKKFLKNTYGFNVLENLNDFPLFMDTMSEEYYSKIANVIDNPVYPISFNERYYIQKIKPFFINQNIYYEVTYTSTDGNHNKFERITAYTNKEILSNYATKLYIRTEKINIYGSPLTILVIEDWEVSIRPCEFNSLSSILKTGSDEVKSSHSEYEILMAFMKRYQMNLVDIIELNQELYQKTKDFINQKSKVSYIFNMLDEIRILVQEKRPGSNILKYLLFHMNNRILKNQYCFDRHPHNQHNGGNKKLSGLRLQWGCIPFDEMPFCTSLINHNPKIYDLLACIDDNGKDDEFLARLVKNNTEVQGKLYTSIKELPEEYSERVEELVGQYNRKLINQHAGRKLKIEKGQIFISQYETDVLEVLNRLKEFSSRNNTNHTKSVEKWLEEKGHNIDDSYKKEKLTSLFSNSAVALVYGSAGTGKTYFINHIAQFFNSADKLFLAVTHTAVENLRRRINSSNCNFSTVQSIIKNPKNNKVEEYDILFVDECSTVSNADMAKLLQKISCKFFVLVGDVFQIEAIQFGNWFELAKEFIKADAIVELNTPYRTQDDGLIEVWNKVRKIEPDIMEHLSRKSLNFPLDESIFEKAHEDEIILSLNYDGIYGINNINRLLQAVNPNPSFEWNSKFYKVNDPIVFSDTGRFNGVLYNNLKGIIRGIQIIDNGGRISFTIELLGVVLNGLDILGSGLELIDSDSSDSSIIRFNINKYSSTDEDTEDNSATVPFQVSYAISIHKAQGLEYESVKIVITNEVDEQINHNILYTAMTRTKKHLRLYWSPETENYVVSHLKRKDTKKDINLLRTKL